MFSKIVMRLTLFLLSAVGFCPIAAGQTCVPPPDGLIAWYRAENNTVDTAAGNNGAAQSGAGFAAGHVGQAFSFDGVDDFVSAPQTTALTSSYTAEAWINPASRANFPVVFERGVGTGNRFGLQILANGTLGAYLDAAGGFHVSGGAIPINTFTHVAYIMDDAANSARLYINGVQVASATENRSPTGSLPSLAIGNSPVSPAADFFGGLIDEFSLYDRALSDAEILGIFNAGTAGKCVAPTAASISVSGRVSTAGGRGIANVRVLITGPDGVTRSALSSPFGHYVFEDLETGETYVVTVRSKRHIFAEPTRVVSPLDSIANVDFIAFP